MDRKYQKVEMGAGAFHHPPRAKYSEETRNLVKILMEESKLSMMQRKSIQAAVNRGESLPLPTKESKLKLNRNSNQVIIPTNWTKRTQEMIIKSGAYEREQFRRTGPLPNEEKRKRHLANIMAYGKEMPESPRGPRLLHRARKEPHLSEDVDALDDLVRGIQERMEFLTDMENLGLGKKYRPIIQQEIAQKIRLIESLDKEKSKELQEELRECQYERPTPKPFPLGELDDD